MDRIRKLILITLLVIGQIGHSKPVYAASSLDFANPLGDKKRLNPQQGFEDTLSNPVTKDYKKAGTFSSAEFIDGTHPELELLIDNRDLIIDFGNTDKPNIRLKFDASSIIKKGSYPVSIKVEAYEYDVQGKKVFLSTARPTVYNKKYAAAVPIDINVGLFPIDYKQVYFDIYDNEGNLVNTYKNEIQAREITTQTATEYPSLTPAECSGSDFAECQLDYILKNVNFEAVPKVKIGTEVSRTEDGKYLVTIPIAKRRVDVKRGNGASGGVSGGLITDGEGDIDSRLEFGVGDLQKAIFGYYPDENSVGLGFASATSDIFKFTSEGKMGVGVTNPTAFIDIQAGTTTTPSMKFEPGALTETPQDGSVEYDGANFYLTSGGERKELFAAQSITGQLNENQVNDKIVITDKDQVVTNKTMSDIMFVSPIRFMENRGEGRILTSDANGYASWSYPHYLGDARLRTGTEAITIGQLLNGNGDYSITIGKGNSDTDRLLNATDNSLVVGFNSNAATLFVGPSHNGSTFGNVGIGTINPDYTLHVNGDLFAQTIRSNNFAGNGAGLYHLNGGALDFNVVSARVGGTSVANNGGTMRFDNHDIWFNGNDITFNAVGATSVKLPTTGTLATLNGVEMFTNKTLITPDIKSPTISSPTVNGNAVFTNGARFLDKIKIADGSQGITKFFVSDATGNGSWQGAYNAIENGGVSINAFTDATSDVNGNLFIGNGTGLQNNWGVRNTASGYQAMFHTLNGNENIAFGYKALFNGTLGNGNVALGFQAGDSITTGSRNIAIGYDVDVVNGELSNQMNIGNTIYGKLDNGWIAIDSTTPRATLDVGGGTPNSIDGNGDLLVAGDAEVDGSIYTTNIFASGKLNGNTLNVTTANFTNGNAATINSNRINNSGTITSSVFNGTNATLSSWLRISSLTNGSIPYIDAAGQIREDNANFFYDNVNSSVLLGGITTATADAILRADGSAVFNNQSNAGSDFNIKGDTDANLFFSDASTDRIGIGTNNPLAKLDINGTIRIQGGNPVKDYVLASIDDNGMAQWRDISYILTNGGAFLDALNDAISDKTSNLFLGNGSGMNNASGEENTGLGILSLQGNTYGNGNSAVGFRAMNPNTTGDHNIAFGAHTLNGNLIGNSNIAIGYKTLFTSDNGDYNLAIGERALYNGNSANANIALGYKAGDNITTGSRNIVIGHDIDAPSATADDQLNIGNTLYGDLAGNNIGIGVANPDARLEVGDGTLTFADGTDDLLVADDIEADGDIYSSNFTATGTINGASLVVDNALINNNGTVANTLRVGNDLFVSDMINGASLNILSDASIGDDLFVTDFINGTSLNISTTSTVGKLLSASEVNGVTANFSGNANIAGVVNGGTFDGDFTNGSVIFSNATGVLSQNNAQFFWDRNNNRLGLGTSAPTSLLDINGRLTMRGGTPAKDKVLVSLDSNGLATWMTASALLTNGGAFLDALNDAISDKTSNLFLGNGSGLYNTGDYNTAVGINALTNLTSGNGNTAYGYRALFDLNNGNNNIAIGDLAGHGQTSGNNNIFLGYDVNGSSSTASNELNIGNAIYGNLSNGNIGIAVENPLNFKFEVAGDIGPHTDSAYDLGSSSLRFANAYVDNFNGATANITTINTTTVNSTDIFSSGTINGTTFIADNATINNDLTVRNNTNINNSLVVTNTINGATLIADNFTINNNGTIADTLNIGNDLFVSDTINADTLIADTIIAHSSFTSPLINSDYFNGGTFDGNGALLTNLNANNVATGILASARGGTGVSNTGSITFGANDLAFTGNDITMNATASTNVTLPTTGTLATLANNETLSNKTILANNGTASSPAFAFVADTNTGIFRAGTDELGFSTAGNEIVRFLSDGNVGIGVTAPNQKLDINGRIRIRGGNPLANYVLVSEDSAGNGKWMNVSSLLTNGGAFLDALNDAISDQSSNLFLGNGAGMSHTTGLYNTAVGINALRNFTSGNGNTAYGYRALFDFDNGHNNIAIGDLAGTGMTTGNNNIFLGYNVNGSSSTASNELNIGNTIYGNLNNGNVGIAVENPHNFKFEVAGNIGPNTDSTYDLGSSSLRFANAYSDNFNGATASITTIHGTDLFSSGTINGTTLLATNATVRNNVSIENNLAVTADATIGDDLTVADTINGSTLIADNATINQTLSSSTLIANMVNGGTFDGDFTNGSLLFSNAAGEISQANSEIYWDRSNNRLGIGTNTPTSKFDLNGQMTIRGGNPGVNKVLISMDSNGLARWTTATDLLNNGGAFLNALNDAISDQSSNLFLGNGAGMNHTAGLYNTAVGINALRNFTTGNGNTAYGYRALFDFDNGHNNIAIGDLAGTGMTTGSNNIFLGYNVNGSSSTASNELNIGNAIYGKLDSGNIGIAVQNPADFKLQIAGNIGPNADSTYDLGSAAKRFANTYSDNFNGATASITSIWSTTSNATNMIADDLTVNNSANIGNDLIVGDNINGADLYISNTATVGGVTTVGKLLSGSEVNGTIANFTGAAHIAGVVNGGSFDGDFTNGSILFSNATGTISQNNAWFFWDRANNRLGLGDNKPSALLDVGNGTINYIDGLNDALIADDLEVNDTIWATTVNGDSAFFDTLYADVVAGEIDVDNGTVGNPSHGFTSDSNTGMYLDDFDRLAFATAGAERLLIDTNGNIGIGLTHPDLFKLQVNGDIGASVDSTYDLGSSAVRFANTFSDNFNGATASITTINSTTLNSATIANSGTITTAKLLASGSVNGATANFSANANIAGVVNGGTFDGDFTNGSLLFSNATGTISQANSEVYWDRANNRLGIGTNTPTSKFDLNGQMTMRGGNPGANKVLVSMDSNGLARWTTANDLLNNGGAFINALNDAISDQSSNLFLGNGAGMNHASGFNNTGVGINALRNFTTGNGNTAYGYRALFDFDNGHNNIAIGDLAGTGMTTGSNNIFLGYNVNGSSSTASNELNIGNAIYGKLDSGNIGIAVQNPADFKLQIAGNIGPNADSTYDLGSAAKRFANTYSDNFNGATASITSIWSTTSNATNMIADDLTVNNSANIGNDLIVGDNINGADLYISNTATVGGVTTVGKLLSGSEVNGTIANFTGAAHIAGVVNGGSFDGDFTNGSILFSNATGTISQNNAWFFWDRANNRLGLGDNKPSALLDVGNGTINYIDGLNDALIADDLEVNDTIWATTINGGTGYYDTLYADVISGQVHVDNGTAASPSHSFTYDTNTGMYLDDYDRLGFATAGIERLLIDTNGNIGVGITHPNLFKFEVNGDIGASVDSTYDLGSSAVRFANTFSDNFNGATASITTINSTTLNSATIANSGTITTAKLLASGSVNGATANFSANANIAGVVNGGTFDGDFTNGSLLFSNATGTISQANSEVYWDRANNRLGIGTNTPTSKFDLNGQMTMRGGNPGANKVLVSMDSNGLARWTTANDLLNNGGAFINALNDAISDQSSNLFLGNGAGMNHASGFNNTGVGINALRNFTTGNGNTAYGYRALFDFDNGHNNIAIGDLAGTGMTTGSNNIFLGYNVNGSSSTASNELNIGNAIYGKLDSGNIGIAVQNPADFKLQIAGNVGPDADSTYDLGSAAKRFANTYSDNFNGATANITTINNTTLNSSNVNAGTVNGGTFDGDFTNGSLLFSNAAGEITQNNANLFWDKDAIAMYIGGNTGSTADLSFKADGTVVINEQGNNSDFRIEGDNNGNLFTTDASTDRVGIKTSAPNSTLQIAGTISMPISTKTTDYTLTESDYSILANASGGSLIVTLPSAAGIEGRVYVIKKVDSSANLVTIDGDGVETIDGSTTYSLVNPYESIKVQSDGTNWYIL